MSHDQKPARVRIIASSPDHDRRRLDPRASASGATPALPRPARRSLGATIVYVVLFLAAAAAGAIAVTLAFT